MMRVQMTEAHMTETDMRPVVRHELTETYENIHRWTAAVQHFEAKSAEAQHLASLLDAELAGLRNVLHPVRAQHTTWAWQGRAAEQSRYRLDRHEDELRLAIRQIDSLIDDLAAHASIANASASASRDALEDARALAESLEQVQQVGRISITTHALKTAVDIPTTQS